MNKVLNLSSSPHVRDSITTSEIMRDVCIALLPTTIYGCIQFGVHALFVVIFSTLFAVLAEYCYEKAMKLPITIGDYSAAVTGLLIGLNCPPSIPIWIPCLGSVFAIIVVKQLYGGLGHNFMNPALAARCFLLLSFASKMTTWTVPGVDTMGGATPLAYLKASPDHTANLLALVFGRVPGTIGEVSKICILIGAIYLIIRDVISPKIPFIYIATVAIFVAIFGGGLMFGAFFMATDYVTSPITRKGQVIYAIILGVITGLFRLFGGSAEGVSYAIILTNIIVPTINKKTIPVAFGKEGAKK